MSRGGQQDFRMVQRVYPQLQIVIVVVLLEHSMKTRWKGAAETMIGDHPTSWFEVAEFVLNSFHVLVEVCFSQMDELVNSRCGFQIFVKWVE